MRALVLLGLLLQASPALAQVYAPELRITGFWPDVALSGGGGIGLGHSLDDNFMGRLRLGALYAYEPFIFNAGVSGQLGALAERGIGGELEVNHFGGGWLQLGLSRVSDGDWMSSVTLGLTVFGVEWQHRYRASDDDALLFTLRLPIGIWWFLLAEHASDQATASDRELPPRPGSPRPAPAPAPAP
jgi:hypothetical protein